MLESLKPFYNNTLRPIARLFLKIGVLPNHVTLCGLFLFIAAGILTAINFRYWALFFVILGALMDGLDGVLARESGNTSAFGAVLDSTCDRITEMAFLGGLAVCFLKFSGNGFYGLMLCYGALSTSVLISYIKARCEGVGIQCKRGILQRPERIILFCIGLAAGLRVMLWILGLIVILGTITVAQRLNEAAAGKRVLNQ